MNMNRKAELQRKLAMKSVPQPPADLRERLIDDIPAYLPPRRRWFARPALQIAASITLLITAVTVTMLHLEPGEEPQMPSAVQIPRAERKSVPAEPAETTVTVASAPATQESPLSPEEERLLTKAEAARRALEIQQARDRRERFETSAGVSYDAATSEAAVEASRPGEVRPAPTAAPPRGDAAVANRSATREPDLARSEVADLMAPAAPPAAPPPPPPAPAAPALAESIAITGQAAPRSRAESGLAAPMQKRLAVSQQSGTLAALAAALQDGIIPKLSEAQIASLIDDAGRTHTPLPGEARLFYEVSQPPVASPSGEVFLRVAVDLRRGITAPLTRLEVVPDRHSAASVERLGDTGSGSELTLRNGELTTLLYAIRPVRGATATHPLVTIRLHERSAEGASLATSSMTVGGADVREWRAATPHHRVVTLAAALADAVNGRFDTAEPIARLAAELAKEHREIPAARDLEQVSRALASSLGQREQP